MHYKRICINCKTIIAECRCADPNKTIVYDKCSNCQESSKNK